ncbi:hypothetical protein ACFL5H_01905 [Candidatus Latescibacterota bacterium]
MKYGMPVLYLLTSAFLATGLSCIFAPAEGQRESDVAVGKWQEPITPGVVIENLKVAFNDRDIDLYERCLHPDYFYESPSETDSLNVESWSRSHDVMVMGKLLDQCTAFIFTPVLQKLVKEYGANMEDIPAGVTVSNEHPDQIWYIYDYDISMDMIFVEYGDFKVQQYMKFVMVEDPPGAWSIIRWIDDTLIIR